MDTMQNSDEDDDFLSADEDGFDGDQDGHCKQTSVQIKPKQEVVSEAKSRNKVIEKVKTEQEISQQGDKTSGSEDSILSSEQDNSCNEELTQSIAQNVKERDSENSSEGSKNLDEEDDDDEEALAERIRERNLKIARKFSAEIARKISKPSAPIPVKTPSQSNRDSDYPSIPGTPNSKTSFLPPAPPPTPALSSSFSNLNDQASHQASASATPLMNSQYNWRVPSAKQASDSSQISSGPRSEDRARQVLDRLAEKLSRTDKNLFERVTEDIKKVSIINEEASPTSNVTSQLPLSSISDLGSALGGWGWSGATKLLSSASQVTSHVGSVLDSVSQHLQPEEKSCGSNAGAIAEQEAEPKSGDSKSPWTDTVPGDPLVDFTLNAMESLGKKAFGVMTSRDESGSLQIKGLGRPWDHLLKREEVASRDESITPPPEPEVEPEPFNTTYETSRSDQPQLPSTLKNRRRRYGDDLD